MSVLAHSQLFEEVRRRANATRHQQLHWLKVLARHPEADRPQNHIKHLTRPMGLIRSLEPLIYRGRFLGTSHTPNVWCDFEVTQAICFWMACRHIEAVRLLVSCCVRASSNFFFKQMWAGENRPAARFFHRPRNLYDFSALNRIPESILSYHLSRLGYLLRRALTTPESFVEQFFFFWVGGVSYVRWSLLCI